jgi:glycosyltransferase involved in cell wall biosynthesis
MRESPVFLEVLTRCYKRPAMLAANQESLRRQTSGDWIQTVLVDDLGRGVAWANQRLGAYAPMLAGDYVWVLDDDDLCTRPTLVAELQSIVANYAPDVIMLRMDHGPLGVLPDDSYWQAAPERGQIGISAFVVRRALWQRHADAWLPNYDSDYDFIAEVLEDTEHVIWHDVIASRVQRISHGEPEHA